MSAGRPASASLVDPEDDLPSPGYGGDFESTTIPHYSATGGLNGSSGFSLLSDPEPLPYVAPAGLREPGGPVAIGPDEFLDEKPDTGGRRGTQDLGLMVLRVGVGVILIAHGLRKAFGLWGGGGPSGLRGALSELGFQHADILTYLAAGSQLAAGTLLVLGLFTPLGGAIALAYLVNGLIANIAVQRDTGYIGFFLPDGIEFEFLLIAAVSAVILAGPGRWGFDAGRGWSRRPFIGSIAAFIVGIGGGIAAWVLLNGTNPLA